MLKQAIKGKISLGGGGCMANNNIKTELLQLISTTFQSAVPNNAFTDYSELQILNINSECGLPKPISQPGELSTKLKY